MSRHGWRFGALSAADILPRLQAYLPQMDTQAEWQLAWLHNDGQPVIGLLPKRAWTLYPVGDSDFIDNGGDVPQYRVYEHGRDTNNREVSMSYEGWQAQLIAYSQAQADASIDVHNGTQDAPCYNHGLIGFIGYDLAARAMSPQAVTVLSDQPAAYMGHYDICLMQQDAVWQLYYAGKPYTEVNGAPAIVNTIANALSSFDTALGVQVSQPVPPALHLQATWQPQAYAAAFERTQDYLTQGDCYQINLTQKWQGTLPTQPPSHTVKNNAPTLLSYLPSLNANTHAPFAGFIGLKNANTAALDFELLSCSPELFFTFYNDNDQHSICTKPIKGTRPRSQDADTDAALKLALSNSEKDRAENVMIVDLLRNDLGRYAKTGSVKVPKLFAIESFSNVHHMVSTITATLHDKVHPLAVLFGSLPAGSITGTPKKRAVEIIHELEAAPRGAYCGTLGYMNFDGSGQWNVLIRTLQAQQQGETRQVNLWAGGGITIASECAAEYQECSDKVGNLLSILAQPN
ncbi:anthranilate synthase component I family protein [Psychrobacter aestuarii]|nr:anthranilate synthase component I family protein [Psychrobacter aestuarii]